MPVERYGTTFGSNFELKGIMHVSGPQAADQVRKEIKDLLDLPGVMQVIVIGDYGTGERFSSYNKIVETTDVH